MFYYPKTYDVIVVGGGHAGVEAALAAARMECSTLLLSMNQDTIGQMSCNPAIGGLAKGHLVREIDALGGEMGKAADLSGIQFRMLNTKNGPAVWAPRAQCDKKAYQFRQKSVCERQFLLDVKQAQVVSVIYSDSSAHGVETTLGTRFHATVVILTTGTFLHGLLNVGANQRTGGRSGEAAAIGLSSSLEEIGLQLGRLKTGTPPRLLRRSVDFRKMIPQEGDSPIPYFTFWKEDLFHVEHDIAPTVDHGERIERYPTNSILKQIGFQLPCHVTYTTERTATLVTENLDKSPMYSGTIEGIGPRYCPSIEDKIVRFPLKGRHQVFIEPEGVNTEEIYVNGLSTSLPFDVQVDLVRTIIGCEDAEIVRPAYAVEYDYVLPSQLFHSLETRICRNLYLAGQINGTSGYEEAAAQGLIAGINAARRVKSLTDVVLRRDEAYIGVLIDDLITKGTSEPYRMFTSRAEHRLLLRQDNADLRLSTLGREIGLLPEKNYRCFMIKRNAIEAELTRLSRTRSGEYTLAQLLRRPEISYHLLPNRDASLPGEVTRQVEIAIKYEGYVVRQQSEVERFRTLEDKQIPETLDFDSVPSLRTEARQKLNRFRPATLGQASRISGVSPADISCLMVWLKRRSPGTDGRQAHSQSSAGDVDEESLEA